MTLHVDLFTNFAASIVAGGAGGVGTPLGASDTSLHLNAGDGTKYASPASGQSFMMLIGSITAANEIVKVTTRSTDTLTITRGQEGTTAAIWPVNTPVTAVATAGNFTNLWNQSVGVFNVRSYGAKGDGVTDDAPAFRLAAADIKTVGGGTLYAPGGTYLIASSIVSPTYPTGIANEGFWLPTNCTLRGDGSGVTVIKQGASMPNQFYLLTNYECPSGGTPDKDITITACTFDGNAANNAASTIDAQYGPNLYHVRGVTIKDVVAKNFRGTTSGGNGTNGTNGESNQIGVLYCVDVTANNLRTTADAGNQTGSGFAVNYCTGVKLSDCAFEFSTLGMGLACYESQNITVATSTAYLCGDHGFNFESCSVIKISASIAGGVYSSYDTSGYYYTAGQSLGNTGAGIRFQSCTDIDVIGCESCNNLDGIDHVNTGAGQLRIHGGVYLNNTHYGVFLDSNAAGKASIHCRPQIDLTNPFGATYTGYASPVDHTHAIEGGQIPPSVPASATAQPNPFLCAATVIITGGTMTAVSIIPMSGSGVSATTVGTGAGSYLVPAGWSITLTYTVAPTWVWTTLPL